MTEFLGNLGLSDVQALELLDDLQPRVQDAIDGHVETANSRGVQATYIWADEGRTVLARPALFQDGGDARIGHLAAKTRPGIHAAMGQLTGAAFERVCLHLLDVYGIDAANRGVLGQSGDEGFDFYGALLPYTRPGSERLYTLGRRFLGQAKLRYDKQVDSDVVAAFGQRLNDVRLGKPAPAKLPATFLHGDEPLVGLLITGGYLAKAARAEARRRVIHYIEGDQVVEDLARSPEVETWLDPITSDFDPNLFLARFTP
jgi:hypothetical protein